VIFQQYRQGAAVFLKPVINNSTMVHLLEWVGRSYLSLYGARSRFMQTKVGKIHFLDIPGTKTGPTLLMLHGISSNSMPFFMVILKLRKHFSRILAPDAIGHGLSEVPEQADPQYLLDGLVGVVDAELEKPAVVLGNSMGGGMAMNLALERPEKIRSLILVSPGGAWMEEAEMKRFLTSFDLSDLQKASDFLRKIYHQAPFYLPIVAVEARRIMMRPWLQRLIREFRQDHLLTPEKLQQLQVPTLIVWGRSDRLMLASMLAFFKAHMPTHTVFEEPDDFGHCPHLDAPQKLSARIVSWVQGLDSSV
jgi:pimeloyl-ACP methyl ester carboxylesterase